MFTTALIAFVALLAPQLERSPADQIPDDPERRVTPEVLVARAARPAVVHITTNVVHATYFGQQQSMGQGSGVVIFEEGFVVTNYHVVKGAQAIRVRFDDAVDRTVYTAQLVSYVEQEDLALLKIQAAGPFPTVPLGTSSDVMIGERVVAIGNPYGQTLTVSAGIVSGLHRDVEADGLRFTNLIQTDASINPGNSGGALLNINGRLIGINTVMNRVAQNIGFAIPVDRVKQVLEDHLLSPSMARTWFGFDLDEERLVVTEVMPGSPADAAGLEPGDRILAIGDRSLESAADYPLARLPLLPERPSDFTIDRDGTSSLVQMSGWERFDALLFQRAGLVVEEVRLNAWRPERNLRVRYLRPDGPAERLGLRVGDFIDAVRPAGRQTYTRAQLDPRTLALVINQFPAGTELAIDVWRDANNNGRREWSSAGSSEILQGTLPLE